MKTSRRVFQKNAQRDVFEFFIIHIFFIKLEKVDNHLSFPVFFSRKT